MTHPFEANGGQQALDLSDKWSGSIIHELMDAAGDERWKKHKTTALREKRPVIPGAEPEAQPESVAQTLKKKPAVDLPTLDQFKATNPPFPPPPKREKKPKTGRPAREAAPEILNLS